jgi:micrococcal nuclease
VKSGLAVASALTAVILTSAACASPPPQAPDAAPLATESATADAVTSAGAGDQSTALGVPLDAVEAAIAQVIDGDTVIVDFEGTRENVRLIGIDTPEPHGGYRPPECFGDEASAHTRQLLPDGTAVLLTRDIEARDVYDRLLGYVYRASDGLFVNLELVESGHADTLSIAPNDTFAADFATAAARARAASTGLWGICGSADVLVAD